VDLQTLINVGATVVLAIVSGFVKSVRSDAKETKDRLESFRLEVAKDYVTHADLREIKDALIRIETWLRADNT
jgi:hypothetical protein